MIEQVEQRIAELENELSHHDERKAAILANTQRQFELELARVEGKLIQQADDMTAELARLKAMLPKEAAAEAPTVG